jgi:hypothetical protein
MTERRHEIDLNKLAIELHPVFESIDPLTAQTFFGCKISEIIVDHTATEADAESLAREFYDYLRERIDLLYALKQCVEHLASPQSSSKH